MADLDSRDNIRRFIDLFYARVLNDDRLSPLFIDVAGINLDEHLGHITDYWCKLLLGERQYQRHTMQKHRALNAKQALSDEDFCRWLALFTSTLDDHFSGDYSAKARRIANTIAHNMQRSLGVDTRKH